MNEWYEQAKRKLEAERNSGSYDRYASAMKGAVCEALDGFCRQDAEFAQAVVQGGTFADCTSAPMWRPRPRLRPRLRWPAPARRSSTLRTSCKGA